MTMLNYKKYGEGPCILLLHGYLESLKIFSELSKSLSENYTVIIPDLPGHGASKVYSETHTMEFMAIKVLEILKAESVRKCSIIGHSMGGYVALQLINLSPELFNACCLLHSHPFTDNSEKKEDREREIQLMKKGRKELLLSASIPKLYAGDNQERMQSNIKLSLSIANDTPVEGITAALNGMKDRPDLTSQFNNKAIRFHLIIGKKDNLIPSEKLLLLAKEHNLSYDILEHSGHMGFLEEQEETERIIYNLLQLT